MVIFLFRRKGKRRIKMRKICTFGFWIVAIMAITNLSLAQNVKTTDAALDDKDAFESKNVRSTFDRTIKIDNAAKKRAEMEQKAAERAAQNQGTASQKTLEDEAGVDKLGDEAIGDGVTPVTETATTMGSGDADESKETDAEIKEDVEKRDLEEIKENLKLSPQELLAKVRKERQEKKELDASAPLKSGKEFNREVKDTLKARREERREMSKEERRAVKDELDMLYKARREERRNFTKEERKAIKEEMKVKEKSRRQQQRDDRKKRREMRKKN